MFEERNVRSGEVHVRATSSLHLKFPYQSMDGWRSACHPQIGHSRTIAHQHSWPPWQSTPFTSSLQSLFLSRSLSVWVCLWVCAKMSKGPGLFSDIGKKARGKSPAQDDLISNWSSLQFAVRFVHLLQILTIRCCLLFRSSNQGLRLRSEIHRLHLQRCWSGKESNLFFSSLITDEILIRVLWIAYSCLNFDCIWTDCSTACSLFQY